MNGIAQAYDDGNATAAPGVDGFGAYLEEEHLNPLVRWSGTFAAAALLVSAQAAFAAEALYTKAGIAQSGHDAVAYFTESKARKGSEEFEYRWNGARWRFASAANRDAFSGSPEKYAPQYGGYCAYAVARNYTAPTDPEAWKVVDGKLYLNYDKKVRALWEKELPAAIARADRNWPGLHKTPAH
jgi:hypothetical protein